MVKLFEFKVKDYTTVLYGQMRIVGGRKIFYIQRGDGTTYDYDEYRLEYWKEIYTDG